MMEGKVKEMGDKVDGMTWVVELDALFWEENNIPFDNGGQIRIMSGVVVYLVHWTYQ